MKKKSILMFDAAYPPPIVGGKEKQAHLLSKKLKKLGHKIKVLSYFHNENRSTLYEGVPVERVPRKYLALPFLFYKLLKERKSFNILHIHTPSRIGKSLVFLGALLNYKIVFKFPGQFLLDSNRNLDKIVWFFLLKFIDLFVVLENDTRRKLSQRGIVPNKIFFVSNGVEINSPIKVDRRINKPIRLVFVGRLSPEKLCDQLIKACSILLKNGVSFRLDIIGDGPLREDLIFLTKELKLENFISINGFSSDIICCMEKSDILILPSKSEGMSNVLLEAISVGLPIVCTDVGSASIQLGGFGRQFLCKPYSPDCLAKKVQILASDYELRKSYSCSLYRRGIEMFSMDSVAKNYINQYEYLDC